MRIAQIVSITVSICTIVALYFLFDIHQEEVSQDSISQLQQEQQAVYEQEGWQYINSVNDSLSIAERHTATTWIGILQNPFESNTSNVEDSLILFYNEIDHPEIAAWFYTEKAKKENTGASWFEAGSIQLMTIQNMPVHIDFREGLFARAIASFETASAMDSRSVEYKVALAEIYLSTTTQTMNGVTLLLDVLKEDSLHIQANILLGRYGIISGQYAKATIRLENVLSLQPENAEALFLLSEANIGLGNIPQAIELLEKCLIIVQNESLKKEIEQYIEELSLMM